MQQKTASKFQFPPQDPEESHLALSLSERQDLCESIITCNCVQPRTRHALGLFLSHGDKFLPHALLRNELQHKGVLSQIDTIMYNINADLRRTGYRTWVELRRTPAHVARRTVPVDEKFYFLILVEST